MAARSRVVVRGDQRRRHELDDRLDARLVPLGRRVDVDRRCRDREAVERGICLPPVLDLVPDDLRVSGLPTLDGEAPSFAPDGRVGMALDDPETSPPEEWLEPVPPERILEGGLGDPPAWISSLQTAGQGIARAIVCARLVFPVRGGPLTTTRVGVGISVTCRPDPRRRAGRLRARRGPCRSSPPRPPGLRRHAGEGPGSRRRA